MILLYDRRPFRVFFVLVESTRSDDVTLNVQRSFIQKVSVTLVERIFESRCEYRGRYDHTAVPYTLRSSMSTYLGFYVYLLLVSIPYLIRVSNITDAPVYAGSAPAYSL